VADTIHVDDEQAFISYYVENSIGGHDLFEFDLKNEIWTNVTADGGVYSGSISQAVIDESKTDGFQLPCLAGPWAAVGCAGAAIVGYFACERRANANIARASAACSANSMSVEIRGVSGCGSVEATCLPMTGFGDWPGDP
jgi:hypothetical protein